MENENQSKDEQFNNEYAFSKRVRAGRRRTYFFDVRTTRSNDFFITITESKKRFDSDGYERHKLHLYKEDFNKFLEAFEETVQHVKTELMPDYDYDEFAHNYDESGNYNNENSTESTEESSSDTDSEAEVEVEAAAETVEETAQTDDTTLEFGDEDGDDEDTSDESWG